MNFSSIPVIDNHIHIFPSRRGEDDLGFAITSYPMEKQHIHSMMPYRMTIAALRRFFQMEGASAEAVMARRNRQFDANPREYIHSLLNNANIKGLICDLDAPISAYWTGNYRTEQEAQDFFEAIEPEIALGRVIRIEVACNKLLSQQLPFADFCADFSRSIDEGIKKYNALALKSVIGYFTGLSVSNPSAAQAQSAYERFLRDKNDGGAEKIWRDYMLHQGLRICREKEIPLHIHTGWGDTPYGDLRRLNPFFLYDFLREEEARSVPIVLLHAGYPYVRETAILASQLPQVYVDFSEMLPYGGHAAETALSMLLETAPLTKVIFGTDGGGVPEPIWFGALYARKILEELLGAWVKEAYFTEKEAYSAAEDILYRTTLRLHSGLEISL